MERKNYESPTMQVVELQVTNQLLAGSTLSTQGEDFEWDEEI